MFLVLLVLSLQGSIYKNDMKFSPGQRYIIQIARIVSEIICIAIDKGWRWIFHGSQS